MTSEIKVDTISEQTSANGVAIDGLTIKDGGITATTGAIVFNEASADLDFRVESNGNTHQLFVDGGNDRIYVGAGSGSSIGSNKFQVQNGGATISSFANDSGSNQLHFIKSRNTTVGSQTIVNDGDSVGGIFWKADDGDATDYNNNVAGIEGVVDGTPGTNDTPGRLVFYTTNDGERTNTERMRITSAGRVGIGTTSPSTQLHVANTGGIELRLDADTDNSGQEDSFIKFTTDGGGQVGIVGMDNNNSSTLFTGNTENAMVFGCVSNLPAVFATNDTERMQITADGKVGIGEASPDADAGGLTLNQGANDANILTLKSSDVAHGMTGSCETDTFGLITKANTVKGGVQIRSFAEDAASERFAINVQGDGDVTEAVSTSTRGAMHFISSNKSGTGQGNMNANGNILSLATYITTRFLFEADGNFHADAGSNTYDAYEDAHLARAYDLSHGKGVIESKFDKFVAYNHEKLADLKLVGREEDGTPNHFVNVTGMQRLHNGAIWQQYEKHQRLAEAVYEMAKETLGKDKADAILEKHDIKLLN